MLNHERLVYFLVRSPPSVKRDERLWGWVCFQAHRIISMVPWLVWSPTRWPKRQRTLIRDVLAHTMVFLSLCKFRRNITALILHYLITRDSTWSDHCVFFVRSTLSKYIMSPSQAWKSSQLLWVNNIRFDFQPRKIDRSIPRTTHCLAQTYINMTTEIRHKIGTS